MPAQTPVESPVVTPTTSINASETTTAVMTTHAPEPTAPLPQVNLNPFAQLIELFTSNPLAVIAIVMGLLLAVLLVIYILRHGVTHEYARKMGEWLANPAVDALVIGLDPTIKEARIIPAKRVGQFLMGLEDTAFTVPVQGGETYTLVGTGKPLVIAVKYTKFGAQWIPGLEQLVSLSVLPITADAKQSEPRDVAELQERLIKNIQTQNSTISGELFIGPDMKIYVSTKVPTALELLAREVAYAASVNLSATISSMHAVAEEGERAMMAVVGAKVRLRMSLAWLILIIAIAVGVLVFLLKMAHVF